MNNEAALPRRKIARAVVVAVILVGGVVGMVTGSAGSSSSDASINDLPSGDDDGTSISPTPAPTPPTGCHRFTCADNSSPYCLLAEHNSASFECPTSVVNTCDQQATASESWPFGKDLKRIMGDEDSTSVPYYKRAVRASSLDPTELVPAYDEVWSDGFCLHDAWQWRPFVDLFMTLMGMEFYFRLYALEMGGPTENYLKAECDMASYFNDHSADATWQREVSELCGTERSDKRELLASLRIALRAHTYFSCCS